MTDEKQKAYEGPMLPKAPDFLEQLLQSIVERVRKSLEEDVHMMVLNAASNISADQIDGLEKFVSDCMDEYMRHHIKVDAEDVEGLDEYIKETLKQATVSIDL